MKNAFDCMIDVRLCSITLSSHIADLRQIVTRFHFVTLTVVVVQQDSGVIATMQLFEITLTSEMFLSLLAKKQNTTRQLLLKLSECFHIWVRNIPL